MYPPGEAEGLQVTISGLSGQLGDKFRRRFDLRQVSPPPPPPAVCRQQWLLTSHFLSR